MPVDWSDIATRWAAREGLPDAVAREVRRFVEEQVEPVTVTVDTDAWRSISDASTAALADEPTGPVARLEAPAGDHRDRYLDLGPIGAGGMGEVRRVRDLALNRTVAMKILRADWVGRPAAEARFLAEAQATAQLQHPGVAPVHDVGRLPDGRWFFTMKEVRGATLQALLERREAGDGPSARRLLEIWGDTCEAVAYAHARGAVHRDLKPSNVVVGEFGEVVVLDWGLVKTRTTVDEPIELASGPGTRAGAFLGTPSWMAPEQRDGGDVGPASDVWALGVLLATILDDGSDPALVRLAASASDADPARRPTSAALVEELRRWLDGEERRARAMAKVELADELLPVMEQALARGRRLELEAGALRDQLPRWAPVEDKRTLWQKEDGAAAAARELQAAAVERLELLRAARFDAPELDEIRDRLAATHQWLHRRAEEDGDEASAREHELLLRANDDGTWADWLRGDGRLTLHTDPGRARVQLFGWRRTDRRPEPWFERDLGTTPLLEVPVPMGSWLLRLEVAGRRPVLLPIRVRRREHVDGVPPGGAHPLPIAVPDDGELGEEDLYVPAGWALLGGRPLDPRPRPPRRVWVDAFVVRRFPVTHEEWIAWLDALVRAGRADEAEQHLPRCPSGRSLYDRALDGTFRIGTDDDGDPWLPRHAVSGVTLASARAYCAWLEERTGRAWRLPWEAEWEKAARGADGRAFAMGEFLDPTWANVRGCAPDVVVNATVDDFPLDESPYGLRGATGGVFDLCHDRWRGEDLVLDGDRPVLVPATDEDFLVVRGGCRSSDAVEARTDRRSRIMPGFRSDRVGFRLARSLETRGPPSRGVAWRFGG